MATRHRLPTEAQIEAADTVRIERVIRTDSMVHAEVSYGTEDADGNWIQHPLSNGKKVAIGDLKALRAMQPDQSRRPADAGPPQEQLDRDIAAYADANDLWHTT